MWKLVNSIVPITILFVILSCQSDTNKANEVLKQSLQMDKFTIKKQEQDNQQKLSIQVSEYTDPVKKAPSQEELIKQYKVKTVKEIGNSDWYIRTYDRKGNMIVKESSNFGKETYSYEFNKKGLIVKQKTKFKDGDSVVVTYEYNDEGSLIRKSVINSSGKTNATTFEYNAKLNIYTESSSTGIEKEFYDNRGLRVRFESYDEKGKLVGSGEARYDKNGLKTSESGTIMGVRVYDEFEYNERAQLRQQHRTGILDVYFIIEYDAKGLKKRYKKIQGGKEETTTYKYTFY